MEEKNRGIEPDIPVRFRIDTVSIRQWGITVIQADGSRLRLSYDERGNITELTDAGGGKSRYAYDALNRVIEAADPKGNRTRFAYDRAGNILSVTNPAGGVRSCEYNESHKVTKSSRSCSSVGNTRDKCRSQRTNYQCVSKFYTTMVDE